MKTKKKSTKSVKSLKAKGLTGKQAKAVKGGIWVQKARSQNFFPEGPPILPVSKYTKW